MTVQIGIKLEPKLLEQIKDFAKEHGTSVSALMRQATVDFMNRSISSVYTEKSMIKLEGVNE